MGATRWPHRLHVVGVSPRTGTTLMYELIARCLDAQAGSGAHEQAAHDWSGFSIPSARVLCSKRPFDLVHAGELLRVDPRLWLVAIVRDPRDVIVSRHRRAPDVYWVGLQVWLSRARVLGRLRSQPRLLTVRYEDLVRDPDGVQRRLTDRVPGLGVTRPFSSFGRAEESVSGDALDALNGVRPPSTDSIGAWRAHRPRVLAQIERHSSLHAMTRLLGEYGYESSGDWESELAGVEPANGQTFLGEQAEHVSLPRRIRVVVAYCARRVMRTARA